MRNAIHRLLERYCIRQVAKVLRNGSYKLPWYFNLISKCEYKLRRHKSAISI